MTSARSINSPALVARDSGFVLAAFVPETDSGIARLTLFADGNRVDTSIIAVAPFDLTLTRMTNSAMLALWRTVKPDDSNTAQLSSALVRLDSGIELGEILVSEQPVVHFDALPQDDASVWVVWSSTPMPESSLFLSRIDSAGRPRQAQKLTDGAAFPRLGRAIDGQTLLTWIHTQDGSIWRAVLSDTGILSEAKQIATTPALEPGDILDDFHIGQDDQADYLFWEILQADGTRNAWYQASAHDGDQIRVQQPLRIMLGDAATLASGFNHGQAQSAVLSTDGVPVNRLRPAAGRGASLPVAVEMDGNQVGVIYFIGGQVQGAQRMTDASLIAAPAIAGDTQRDLSLAWWDAQADTAILKVLYSAR